MIWLELALIAFVIGSALFVAFARDVVGAIVTFAAFSLGIAIIWILLAAPDVALVEAAVGAGVVSVLFLVTLVKTTGKDDDGRSDEPAFRSLNVPAVIVLGALAIPLGYTFLSLPPVGATEAPAVSFTTGDGSLTPYGYYIEQTLPETGFPNAVVAVLVVYRGLDTLGELIVAFAAAVSVLVVLEREDLV